MLRQMYAANFGRALKRACFNSATWNKFPLASKTDQGFMVGNKQ